MLSGNQSKLPGRSGLSRVVMLSPLVCLVTLIMVVVIFKDGLTPENDSAYWQILGNRASRTASYSSHSVHDEGDSDATGARRAAEDEVDAMLSFGTTIECEVSCETGVPCEYESETDFRVIILAYNDAARLEQCLRSLNSLDTFNDDIIVDIWIDRSHDAVWNDAVLKVATHFVETWSRGSVCIHLQEYHAGVKSQWINAWQPKINTSEIALIVEEDVLLGPFVYKWLKSVWQKYVIEDTYGISGVSLIDENLRYDTKRGTKRIKGPDNDSVYAYRALSGGAFVPNPKTWRVFQQWYAKTLIVEKGTKIVIPGYLPENWYQENSNKGIPWEMWYIYFCEMHKLYSIYPNLGMYTGMPDMALVYHAGQAGMTGIARGTDGSPYLMKSWSKLYVSFPNRLAYLDYDGSTLGST